MKIAWIPEERNYIWRVMKAEFYIDLDNY